MTKPMMRAPALAKRAFSSTRLQRLHLAMQRYVDSGELPGLVLLVSHRDRIHVEALGTFGFENPTPMQPNTLFRLASMSKPITAVAVMILIEECRLRLDDPVEDWLPELKDRKVLKNLDGPLDDTVPAKRPITVRDLLSFRSGYGEVGFLSPMSPLQIAMVKAQLPLSVWPFQGSADEFMRKLGDLPLAFQPGERWMYHMSAEILGVLIARVSGMPLSRFLQERICGPLGMKDTAFHVPEAKRHRLPYCYGSNFPGTDLILLDDPARSQYAEQPVFESGGGGLVSTVDDMLAFGHMMLRKGKYGQERILSRSAFELMTSDQITPEQKALSPFFPNFWDVRSWGLGLSIVTQRRDLADNPGRLGWDGAFGTSWSVDPKEDLVGVLMTQRRPSRLDIPPVIRDFWTSVYQLIDD